MDDQGDEAEEYEKLVDLVTGARPDAIRFYGSDSSEAGIRIRSRLDQIEKYTKFLRADSLAIDKGEARPKYNWQYNTFE